MTENNISAGFLPTSEKKKVLIFSLAYRPLIGGAEIALEEITKRISNYEFHLITARFDAKNLPYEKLGNVFVYRVGWGIKWDKYDVEQFRMGLDVELEHGTVNSNTNVTNDDPVLTGKIALAHLNEYSDYYTRLYKMEAEAEAQ